MKNCKEIIMMEDIGLLTRWKNGKRNNFPWWSTKTIERAFKSLISSGIVITGNYNKDQRDRTKWYSINEDVLENILNGIVKENPKTNSQCASGQNDERHRQNDEMQQRQFGGSITREYFQRLSFRNYYTRYYISYGVKRRKRKMTYHSNEVVQFSTYQKYVD